MKTLPAVRLLIFVVAGLALLVLLLVSWAGRQLQHSLAVLDGERRLAGLGAPAELSRDALGTAIVRAASRADAGRALGFAHGQDRFFQMDIMRRRGAGELAALLGAAVVDHDRSVRIHGFRRLATIGFEREPAARQELLRAYAEGVNAGLSSLGSKPWEYHLLRTSPTPWQPEDAFLVLYAMALDLQESEGRYDQMLTTVRDQLGARAVDFFNPPIGPTDGALDGTVAALPAPPSPRVINLRTAPAPAAAAQRRQYDSSHDATFAMRSDSERWFSGSNAFALSGAGATSTPALLAGDPHLSLRVPNTWYRAQLEWSENGQPVRVVGVSLPGAPGIIIGSNGHVAWTFTNAYVDTGDLVLIDRSQVAPELFYHQGQDTVEFERRTDTIQVKGGDPVTVESVWTAWGPLVGESDRGKQLAYKWTMHDPEVTNFESLELALARSVDDATAIARRSGIPAQNLIAADATGRTAWTIAGRLPRRFGFDGRFPVAWTYGDRGWNGYLEADEVPIVEAEPGQALWSGNQRHIGGEPGARLGDGGYYEGHRGNQIRDALAALPQPISADDLRTVQLNTRAEWLAPWREKLLETLDDGAVSGESPRAEFRRLVAAESSLQADIESVGYRLLREWYDRLEALTLTPIFARCVRADPDFNYRYLRTDAALQALHEQEPEHLLGSEYASWHDLRLAAVDAVLARLEERKVRLGEARWGERNRAAIQHPLSSALPAFLARRIDLAADPLPGDHGVIRVQRPSFGASLRMVVAPGQEAEGTLHMPGGQSGHPWSPFYRAGHDAWVSGQPLPLLAGEPLHTLTLRP